jgi:hypothetical protein
MKKCALILNEFGGIKERSEQMAGEMADCRARLAALEAENASLRDKNLLIDQELSRTKAASNV